MIVTPYDNNGIRNRARQKWWDRYRYSRQAFGTYCAYDNLFFWRNQVAAEIKLPQITPSRPRRCFIRDTYAEWRCRLSYALVVVVV